MIKGGLYGERNPYYTLSLQLWVGNSWLKAFCNQIIKKSKEYQLGPHVYRYLEVLEKDPSLLGWGVWFVIDKEKNTVSWYYTFDKSTDDKKWENTVHSVIEQYKQPGQSLQINLMLFKNRRSNPTTGTPHLVNKVC